MTPAEFRLTLKDLGISQRDLTERLGLAASTVNRWAMGQASVPQYAAAYLSAIADCQRLAHAFAAAFPGVKFA
jgi:transcriptional regulator with XRE-family HTH domain